MIRTTAKMSNDTFPYFLFPREAKALFFPGVPMEGRLRRSQTCIWYAACLSLPSPPLPPGGASRGPDFPGFLDLGFSFFSWLRFLVWFLGAGLRQCLDLSPYAGGVAYHPNSHFVSGPNSTSLAVFLRFAPNSGLVPAPHGFLEQGLLLRTLALAPARQPQPSQGFPRRTKPSGTFCSAEVDMRLTIFGTCGLYSPAKKQRERG